MILTLTSIALLFGAGLLALLTAGRRSLAQCFGVWGGAAGCLLGLSGACQGLATGGSAVYVLPWMTPAGGAFSVGLDPLSAFFLIPLFLLGGLGAIYGAGYLHPERLGAMRTGTAWFCYNLLTASMALVVISRNALLFLVAWEIMALASFFLVTLEDEHSQVRQAGRIYLIATHIGTAFLVAMFLLLGRSAHSLEFADIATALCMPGASAAFAATVFLLALVGFGTKAGFMPLHVWLPEAHPAAPSHVSAVMSGVMIKTGIYGLLRTLTFLGPPPLWWGWTMVGIGASSGVLGVLFALAQHDLKRLLAYHSVENIGIIALGIGTGLLGMAAQAPLVAAAGFAGALLHVFNHAVFKGLLFLGAGAVYHATGTREMDHLGGLLKRMPRTGSTFLVGAAAISGLPPLNGFVSEFLIYAGALVGLVTVTRSAVALPLLGVVFSLALIGGLAAACFAKAFGIVFLGEPRHAVVPEPRDPGPSMSAPMVVLAGICVLVGVLAPFTLLMLRAPLAVVCGVQGPVLVAALARLLVPLLGVTVAAVLLALAVLFLLRLRRHTLRGRVAADTVTWDCGYARPTPRMQYTASSFAQPILALFGGVASRHRFVSPSGFFPRASSMATEARDLFRERMFAPLFRLADRWISVLRWLQHGRVQLYVVYVVATLLALLAWNLGRGG